MGGRRHPQQFELDIRLRKRISETGWFGRNRSNRKSPDSIRRPQRRPRPSKRDDRKCLLLRRGLCDRQRRYASRSDFYRGGSIAGVVQFKSNCKLPVPRSPFLPLSIPLRSHCNGHRQQADAPPARLSRAGASLIYASSSGRGRDRFRSCLRVADSQNDDSA